MQPSQPRRPLLDHLVWYAMQTGWTPTLTFMAENNEQIKDGQRTVGMLHVQFFKVIKGITKIEEFVIPWYSSTDLPDMPVTQIDRPSNYNQSGK